jgi:hypothetical protein
MIFRLRTMHLRVALKFKKKPIPVEAVQIDKEESLDTLEGKMTGQPGDWKIKGVEGEEWFIKDSIFRKTYEPLDDEAKAAWKEAYGD